MTDPIRVEILHAGAALTNGDRDVSYGDPLINLSLAGRLKQCFRDGMVRKLGYAELEAIDQVLTKIARVATGGEVKVDTYIDGATYFAIAGECAMRMQGMDKDAKFEKLNPNIAVEVPSPGFMQQTLETGSES